MKSLRLWERRGGRSAWAGPAILLALLTGCHAEPSPQYQDERGFRFTPPPGWVERARPEAVPGGSNRTNPRGQKQPDLPLPPLEPPERLLARYDRLTAGHLAWLRLTMTDLPAAALTAHLSTRAPKPNWQREGEAPNLEVGGLPAARIAFAGRWDNQEYLCETVAVRKGEWVYLLTAAFPADDVKAREQVRAAVAGAVWP